jgi:hypothetical protein
MASIPSAADRFVKLLKPISLAQKCILGRDCFLLLTGDFSSRHLQKNPKDTSQVRLAFHRAPPATCAYHPQENVQAHAPIVEVEKNGSKIFSISLSAIPRPVSLTSRQTWEMFFGCQSSGTLIHVGEILQAGKHLGDAVRPDAVGLYHFLHILA